MDDGYKGSYTSYPKKMGWVEKPSFTFPGFGSGIDIHKQIGKLPKSKAGWNLPGHKYTGPYNDLENQVKYNPETGEILEISDQPILWTCNMMLIIVFAVITESVKIKLTVKW